MSSRPAVMPCDDIISWLIYQADVENRLIKDDQEGKAAFKSRQKGVYPTINIHHPYRYAVALISRIYDEKDATHGLAPTAVQHSEICNYIQLVSHFIYASQGQHCKSSVSHSENPPLVLHVLVPAGQTLCLKCISGDGVKWQPSDRQFISTVKTYGSTDTRTTHKFGPLLIAPTYSLSSVSLHV
ncbi:hypothetical protein SUGI_1226290 [Cryptomeria japonica]|uniref:Uncharacterized protein n=1 Tax=Cryptomeria japonica TaxID=3369 RepID=A0AAD3RNU5_CRYJA|nr:hypothetical protein SUGI_1226290 [Cryptomeria japonica]